MKKPHPFIIASLVTFLAFTISFMLSSYLLALVAPMLLFLIMWFVLPYIALVVAGRFKKVNPLPVAISGMIISFAFILFMIYKQLDTDFGVLFQISFIVNLVMIPLYWYLRKTTPQNIPKLKL